MVIPVVPLQNRIVFNKFGYNSFPSEVPCLYGNEARKAVVVGCATLGVSHGTYSPMHCLGPSPKGRKDFFIALPKFSGAKRSGLNSSGSET